MASHPEAGGADVWAEFEAVFRFSPTRTAKALDSARHLKFVPGLPILDYGSGSGFTLKVLLDNFPSLEVVAVEDNRIHRSALTAMVASTPEYRQRVTIINKATFETRLFEPYGGAIFYNVLHLISRAEASLLLQSAIGQLAPRSSVVLSLRSIETQGLDSPVLVARENVGQLWYERWFKTSTDSSGRHEWSNAIRVIHGNSIIREEEFRISGPCATATDIREIMNGFGYIETVAWPDVAIYEIGR